MRGAAADGRGDSDGNGGGGDDCEVVEMVVVSITCGGDWGEGAETRRRGADGVMFVLLLVFDLLPQP